MNTEPQVPPVKISLPSSQIDEAKPPEGIESEPVDPEIVGVQRDTGVNMMAADDPGSLPQMGPQEQALVREHMIRRLKEAMDAESRVKMLAKLTDTYGVDAIIGAMAPALGDLATSVAYTVYLMHQAKRAGLDPKDKKKIFKYQGVDLVIGGLVSMIPGGQVIADFLADFAVRGNSMSLKLFKENVAKLIKEAREAGVSDEAIQEMQKAVIDMENQMGVIARIIGSRLPKKPFPAPNR